MAHNFAVCTHINAACTELVFESSIHALSHGALFIALCFTGVECAFRAIAWVVINQGSVIIFVCEAVKC